MRAAWSLSLLSLTGFAFVTCALLANADTVTIVSASPNPVQPLTIAFEVLYGGTPTVQFPCPLTLSQIQGGTTSISASISVPPATYKMGIPATTPMGVYTLQLNCANGLSPPRPHPYRSSPRQQFSNTGYLRHPREAIRRSRGWGSVQFKATVSSIFRAAQATHF